MKIPEKWHPASSAREFGLGAQFSHNGRLFVYTDNREDDIARAGTPYNLAAIPGDYCWGVPTVDCPKGFYCWWQVGGWCDGVTPPKLETLTVVYDDEEEPVNTYLWYVCATTVRPKDAGEDWRPEIVYEPELVVAKDYHEASLRFVADGIKPDELPGLNIICWPVIDAITPSESKYK